MVEIIIKVGDDGKTVVVEGTPQSGLSADRQREGKRSIQVDERIRTTLFESNINPSLLFDSAFNVADCNPAAQAFFKFRTREALLNGLNARFKEWTPKYQSNGQRTTPIKERFLETVEKSHVVFELEIIMDNHRKTIAVDLEKIPFDDDYIIVMDIMDLSNLQAIEKEYKSTREQNEMQMAKMNLAIQSAKIGLWEADFVNSGDNVYKGGYIWSEEFRHILGYEDENDFPNLFESWENALHSEDRETAIHAFTAHLTDITDSTPYDIEYRAIKKNGDCIYVHDTGKAFRKADGTVLRAVGAIQDITASKIALLEREVQLTKFNLAVKTSMIGLWDRDIAIEGDSHDPNSVLIYSDEIRQILGYEDEHDFPNLNRSIMDAIHPEDKDWVTTALANHIADTTDNTPFDIEHRMVKKSGEIVYVHATGKAMRDKHGKATRLAGTLMDVTKVKKLILEAESQKEEAEAANKAKSSFLSTMSHEIRTPMNAILGITEIQLQNDDLDPELKEALRKIYTSGDMLLGIINDILDLSKIEAGKLELSIDKYEIASLVSDTAQLNMMRIGSKPIEFDLHIDENVPAHVSGDELRVKQILNNLLSNAFKYTKSGTVTLSVTSKPRDNHEDDVILIVEVKDTGLGMSKEQVTRLFDEYSRFNMAANRTTEGTGLGMSITRNLIDLMDGEIFIDSEEGKGSTFTIHLPQGSTDSAPLGKEMAENLHNFRTSSRAQMRRVQVSREPMPYGKVLITDDVETNIYVAKGLMLPYKLNIDTASSGFDAIKKVEDGSIYDIIFMDHMMPEMDGIETTKRLRAMGYHNPIVALTANAVAGQADVFMSNGFDGFISKPIDIRQLNNVLNKFVRDKNKQPQGVEIIKDEAQQPEVDPEFAAIFVRDAEKSLAVLSGIMDKGLPFTAEDLRSYIIHVHGMKSALECIGMIELSAIARKLEQCGRDEHMDVITSQTPQFLIKLRTFAESLKPKDMDGDNISETAEDMEFLRRTLLEIKIACEAYDEITVEKAVNHLKDKPWSSASKKVIDDIERHLLHSDFDEVIKDIEAFL
ncbi:MAG: PAS domain-containing protein [Defluviitaleaceae bacterium]|nr:PAS domain-containing protein [Defluviitaleaceae bacterium]